MFFRRTEHKIRIGVHYVSDWHYLLTLNQILYLKIFSICNVSWKSLLRNNKLASLEATLVRNYYRLTHWLTGVKWRATSVAKKYCWQFWNMISFSLIYEEKIGFFEWKYVFRDICLQKEFSRKEGWASLSIPQGEALFVMTLLKYLNRNLNQG